MTRALRSLLPLALSLASLGSCSPTPGAIGVAGGSVAASDGARVTIPAGAIEGSIPITATSIAAVGAPASSTIVGTAVTFGPEGQLFAKPVIVTLPITTSLLPTGMSALAVVIYTAPAGTTSYTALKTTVVDATHVAAPVGHFSTFVPAVASPCLSKSDCYEGESCIDGVCVGPGACSVTQSGTLQFCFAWSTLAQSEVESLCPTGSSSSLTTYTLGASCPTANVVGTCAYSRTSGGTSESYSENYYAAPGITCANARTACQQANGSGTTTMFTGIGC